MILTAQQIATFVEGELIGDASQQISGVAPVKDARAEDVTYATDKKYLLEAEKSGAGLVIIPYRIKTFGKPAIRAKNPELAFTRLMGKFHPPSKEPIGIHATAIVGEHFTAGEDLSIGPHVVIGKGVTCGSRVEIHSNVVIGNDVTLGDDVIIRPNATVLDNCQIGNRVSIWPGTVIGSDGFGHAHEKGVYHKIPHLGIVKIDDDVEIGACCTIDRARFNATWIQRGVKIDNQVHVAHNVVVGEDTVLVSQVGIAGSVTIGKHAILAGQAGIAGHLELGDNVIVGPQAGVGRSTPKGAVVSGSVAMPHRIWLRVQGILPKLPDLVKRLANLEKELSKLIALKKK